MTWGVGEGADLSALDPLTQRKWVFKACMCSDASQPVEGPDVPS